MKVHRYLGNGLQEVIYHRCLEIEFKTIGLNFEHEKDQKIFYESACVGTRRVDSLVDSRVLVELKAVSQLEDAHLAQAINYLEAFQLEIGLLINFGARSLQFKRVQNLKFVTNEHR